MEASDPYTWTSSTPATYRFSRESSEALHQITCFGGSKKSTKGACLEFLRSVSPGLVDKMWTRAILIVGFVLLGVQQLLANEKTPQQLDKRKFYIAITRLPCFTKQTQSYNKTPVRKLSYISIRYIFFFSKVSSKGNITAHHNG